MRPVLLAPGLSWLGSVAGVGGLVFLVSGAMIVLGAFARWFDPRPRDSLVMLAHVATQVLLAHATAVRSRAEGRDTLRTSGVPGTEPG